MKISKRTREQAALICALSASSDKGQHITGKWIGTSRDARDLARDAYYAVSWAIRYESDRHSWAEINAEAEAMLRCGWSP